MNFEQYLKKKIKEINPEMHLTQEGSDAIKKAVDEETYVIAKLILEHRNHKTIMPDDVDFGLMFRPKYGYPSF